MTSNPHTRIKLLAPADAALFRDIRLEALAQNPEAFGSTFERENEQPLPRFEQKLTQTDIFGAFVEDDLAGIAGYMGHDSPKHHHKGVLWTMYVRPAARNSGLGKRLVEAVVNHASGRVEQLQLSVVSDNQTAHRLYANLGFVEYGREPNALKQSGRYYDEILMVKFLTPN
jgi:ribosomal protein S18 acetylase RimI-like enzyme